MKYYCVKYGRTPGIYTSWVECEKQVKGFSKAIYKSFKSKKEAEAFLNDDKINVYEIEIYTDGSHMKHGDNYLGIGAFCSYLGKEYKLSKNCSSNLLEEYGIKDDVSNPTAEFIAFCEVLKMIYLLQSSLNFVFKIDYNGIEKWMNGTWNCREKYIKKIKEKCDFYILNMKSKIKIEHVSGHSNNYGNDQADILAKSKIEINTFDILFSKIK